MSHKLNVKICILLMMALEGNNLMTNILKAVGLEMKCHPMVDACIRALTATGWLNFRMRTNGQELCELSSLASVAKISPTSGEFIYRL